MIQDPPPPPDAADGGVAAWLADHPLLAQLLGLGALVAAAALALALARLCALLAGIGAMTAVLLLIFKDTILSAVASVQLTNVSFRQACMIETGSVPTVGGHGTTRSSRLSLAGPRGRSG